MSKMVERVAEAQYNQRLIEIGKNLGRPVVGEAWGTLLDSQKEHERARELLAEAGFAETKGDQWVGVFAPAKTPEPIVTRLAQITSGALADNEFQGKLEAAGFEPRPGFGPNETATYIKEEIIRWTPILKQSGMKPE